MFELLEVAVASISTAFARESLTEEVSARADASDFPALLVKAALARPALPPLSAAPKVSTPSSKAIVSLLCLVLLLLLLMLLSSCAEVPAPITR
jgi:hypothetical protein